MKTMACRLDNIRRQLPASVGLIAVSKTVDTNRIRQAYQLGQRDFGENRVQELYAKAKELEDLRDIRWHFIGHLQSNKVKKLLSIPNLYLIHSIDSVKLATLIHRQLAKQQKTIDVLLQVNTSKETSKYGCLLDEAEELVKAIESLDQLRLRGLMTIGRLGGDEQISKECFFSLVRLQEKINSQALTKEPISQLSMGMSNDYPIAIQLGATWVRIGQAIFGQRQTPDHFYWPESTRPNND